LTTRVEPISYSANIEEYGISASDGVESEVRNIGGVDMIVSFPE
jgi:hypothetical protein